ncbi:MAG TPA: asparagine synthase (glutamine-hydrolyzing) [Myxococcota bacterium]|nr:asparagine synthase (glutamine-hydrolyzing) [Myxococcota bacterium]
MCGIAGAFNFRGPVDRGPVAKMVRVLEHRGPDDEHIVEVAEGALAARRLAIVDRENGRQPLSGGGVWVAFNGEIYNHNPLRSEHAALGFRFDTECDTEVLAALTAEVGLKRGLRRTEGMFAVAAWQPGTLWLARDRLGQKPLYWTRLEDGTVLFASELKGLLVHPGVSRRIDEVALSQYLMFEYVPAPRSIYADIHKLEAGTVLVCTAEGERLERWWDPPLPGHGAQRKGIAEERWVEAITTSLRMAVRKRCDTDLPLAILLSGGIDSSAIAALAVKERKAPLHSFSLVFDEQSFDESGPARAVAEHLCLEHTEVRFRAGRMPEVLDALSAGMCEPLADGSLPSTWVLAEGIRAAGHKLAISGDGADEHFGGYPTYFAHRIAAPASVGSGLLGRVAGRLPASRENLGAGYLARRFTAGLPHALARRNQVWLGAFLPDELEPLLGLQVDPWDTVDRWGRVVQGLDVAEAAMFLDQRLYLGEGVLAKADRATMLHSIELRSPFLDHRLVELAQNLPVRHKIRGRKTKVLLRRALSGLVPDWVVERPKKGFGTPLAHWLAGPCKHLLDDLPESLEGLCDPQTVRRILDEHERGHRDHRRRLWTLLTLSRWRGSPWGPT